MVLWAPEGKRQGDEHEFTYTITNVDDFHLSTLPQAPPGMKIVKQANVIFVVSPSGYHTSHAQKVKETQNKACEMVGELGCNALLGMSIIIDKEHISSGGYGGSTEHVNVSLTGTPCAPHAAVLDRPSGLDHPSPLARECIWRVSPPRVAISRE